MKRKNNKGFTLVELLAVIVVLAIVMLVVADRVGDAMLQSRANSLALQIKSLSREVEKECAMKNEVTAVELKKIINSGDLKFVNAVNNTNTNDEVYVQAQSKSKFANIKVTDDIIKINESTGSLPSKLMNYNENKLAYEEYKLTKDSTPEKKWLREPIIKFSVSCPIDLTGKDFDKVSPTILKTQATQ